MAQAIIPEVAWTLAKLHKSVRSAWWLPCTRKVAKQNVSMHLTVEPASQVVRKKIIENRVRSIVVHNL